MYIPFLTVLFIVHVVELHAGISRSSSAADFSKAKPFPNGPGKLEKSKSKRTTTHRLSNEIMGDRTRQDLKNNSGFDFAQGRRSFGASSSTNPADLNPLSRSLSMRSNSSISNRINKINKISQIEEKEITENKVASEQTLTLIDTFDDQKSEIFKDLLNELNQNLEQIDKQKLKWSADKKKNDYDKQKKDLETIKNKESPCEEILPLSAKGKEYKKIKEILDKLTSWNELKRSFSNDDDAESSTAGQSPFYSSTESNAGEVKEKEKKKGGFFNKMSSFLTNSKKKSQSKENHLEEFLKKHESLVPAQHLDKARKSLDLFSPKNSPSGNSKNKTESRTQSELTPKASSSAVEKFGKFFRSSAVSVSTTQKTTDKKQEQKGGRKVPMLQQLPTKMGDGVSNSIYVRSKSVSVPKEASSSKLGTEQSVGSSGPVLKRASSRRRNSTPIIPNNNFLDSMEKEESETKSTKNPQKGQSRNSEPTERKRVSFELTTDQKEGLLEDELEKRYKPKHQLTLSRALSTREVGGGHKKADEGRRSSDNRNSINEKLLKLPRSSTLSTSSSMRMSQLRFTTFTNFSPIEEERNVEENPFELPFGKSNDRKSEIIEENVQPFPPPNPREIGIINSSANNLLSKGHRRSFELPKENSPQLSRSLSVRLEPMSVRVNKSKLYANSLEEEGVVKDGVLCKANWNLIEDRLNYFGEDKELKHELFHRFRRANYFLQFVILLSTLYRQSDYALKGKNSKQEMRAKIINDENMLNISKQLFMDERNQLSDMIKAFKNLIKNEIDLLVAEADGSRCPVEKSNEKNCSILCWSSVCLLRRRRPRPSHQAPSILMVPFPPPLEVNSDGSIEDSWQSPPAASSSNEHRRKQVSKGRKATEQQMPNKNEMDGLPTKKKKPISTHDKLKFLFEYF
ncbi:hypothetical protein niasHT_013343 [Heterodera trifolii]|uniref:Uncharacterized protein n=1 Tax=Heterodera trifolii TaxID=157864 RepID=A0ABD2L7V0_9BILA